MRRDIQEDYEKLILYLSNYSLTEMLSNQNFIKNIKSIHRKSYAYLMFNYEIKQYDCESKLAITYFDEVGSDLLLSLFCWSNGAYKPAELQLRCCIENFLKAALIKERPDIITLKNVYEIFNTAEDSLYFKNNLCLRHFNSLKNVYSSLCAIVHSSQDKLLQTQALISLSHYDIKNAEEFHTNFQNTLNSILSILYYNYYEMVYKMPSSNRELFLQGIQAADKSKIYNEKVN